MQRVILAWVLSTGCLLGCPSDSVTPPVNDTMAEVEPAVEDVQVADAALPDTSPAPDTVSAPDTQSADTTQDTGVADTAFEEDTTPAPKAFFDPSVFGDVKIVFGAEAATKLLDDEQATVPVTITIDEIVFEGATLRLYGPDGSSVAVTDKAGFIIELDPNGDASLEGYRSIILDNLKRDAGMVREHIGNLLFRTLGVPAPKTRYASVTVNGQHYGLYLMMERPTESVFQNAWFSTAGNAVYFGKKDVDLNGDGLGKFTATPADPEKAALEQLITAIDAIGDDDIYNKLDAIIDMDRYLWFAAIEVFLGIKRGYVNGPRNYAIIQDAGDGRWTFMPWELPRTMRDGLNPLDGRGRIQKLCLKDLPCRIKLGERYQAVYEAIESNGLANMVIQAKPFLLDMFKQEAFPEHSLEEVTQSINTTAAYLNSTPGWLIKNLECIDPTQVDEDGDGYSGCDVDCDDSDPLVHPDAPELCNLKDDNCDGAPDNAEQCPKCTPYTSTEGVAFTLCLPKKTWQEAEDDCIAQGGHLASIRTPEDQDELLNLSFDIWWHNWWIGLSDQAEEGNFVWSDGAPVSYLAWAANEPNDSNGEDCGHFWSSAGGLWNDIPCDTKMPYICRFEADPAPPEDNP